MVYAELAASREWEGLKLFLEQAAAAGDGAVALYLDAALVSVVAVLALVVLADGVRQWYGYLVRGQPWTSSEVLIMAGGSSPAGARPSAAAGDSFTVGGCC